MSRKSSVLTLAITVFALGTIAAQAHPKLLQSFPARDAKLTAAPKEIRMSFSEGLIANFTGLELKDGRGKSIATGKSAMVLDNKTLVVPVAARLVPGSYTVNWHAVSVDTHRVSGTYGFKVAR